jgi:hypothetical protein
MKGTLQHVNSWALDKRLILQVEKSTIHPGYNIWKEVLSSLIKTQARINCNAFTKCSLAYCLSLITPHDAERAVRPTLVSKSWTKRCGFHFKLPICGYFDRLWSLRPCSCVAAFPNRRSIQVAKFRNGSGALYVAI